MSNPKYDLFVLRALRKGWPDIPTDHMDPNTRKSFLQRKQAVELQYEEYWKEPQYNPFFLYQLYPY